MPPDEKRQIEKQGYKKQSEWPLVGSTLELTVECPSNNLGLKPNKCSSILNFFCSTHFSSRGMNKKKIYTGWTLKHAKQNHSLNANGFLCSVYTHFFGCEARQLLGYFLCIHRFLSFFFPCIYCVIFYFRWGSYFCRRLLLQNLRRERACWKQFWNAQFDILAAETLSLF